MNQNWSAKFKITVVIPPIYGSYTCIRMCNASYMLNTADYYWSCDTQVTEAHKRHGTPPHCIFAVDNLVHRAVSEVLSIVSPGSCSL